jgi:hypothetical protein
MSQEIIDRLCGEVIYDISFTAGSGSFGLFPMPSLKQRIGTG